MFSNMRKFLPARAFPGAARFGKKSSLVDEPFWICARGAAVLRNIQDSDRTKKKVTGRFGMEWVGGARPLEINALHNEVKQERKTGCAALEFSKYNPIVSGLGGEYFLRDDQKHPLTYFNIRKCPWGDPLVAVGSTSPQAREHRLIDNYLKERTRGFAVQIILDGRGVKAYFDPAFPHFKVRLGVGTKEKDLSQYCLRDPDCTVSVNKAGLIVVVHGPTKERVGVLAYRLMKKMQPRLMPYTGKGAHFAFHEPKRKAVRKK